MMTFDNGQFTFAAGGDKPERLPDDVNISI